MDVKKLAYKKNGMTPSSIESVTGDGSICNMWEEHYKYLLNSSNDTTSKKFVIDFIEAHCSTNGDFFTLDDVASALSDLKKGKSKGQDGLSSEHYLYADKRIYVYLQLLFNAMMCHGYVPEELMSSVVIPIVKDKKAVITSKDNYRPIVITNVSSKIP